MGQESACVLPVILTSSGDKLAAHQPTQLKLSPDALLQMAAEWPSDFDSLSAAAAAAAAAAALACAVILAR